MPSNVKIIGDYKFVLAGRVGASCATKQMLHLSMSQSIPVGRFRAWYAAFRHTNQERVGWRCPPFVHLAQLSGSASAHRGGAGECGVILICSQNMWQLSAVTNPICVSL